MAGSVRGLTAAPGYEGLKTAGGMGGLLVAATRAAVRRPFSWRDDAVVETSVAIRRTVVPLVLSAGFFALGLLVLYFGGVVKVLGTLDRLGGGDLIGFIREAIRWVSMMVIAGVVGSAITADLGSRKIREELDALAVLGVDQVQSLVVPRIIALTVAMPVLSLIALGLSTLISYVAATQAYAAGMTAAAFRQSFWAFAYSADVIGLVVEMAIVGLFVGVVACYKGLNAAGSTEGVGRAVSECVLISFLGAWVIHTLFQFVVLSLFPGVLSLRG
ncbi:MAG: phospholipid/cholesterol/gamma-HCH transport system permease protein [Solirubrobacteraceae bacterium]|nr:phospholipid/cholesterol/gamma-HCH transport system permease protein [Solirubrobacteraceae bacterium]